MNVYDYLNASNEIQPTFPGLDQETHEINPVLDLGIQAGLTSLVPKLGRLIGKRSMPGLLANAIAGGLYGAGRATYEGKGFGDIVKEGLLGTVEWPALDVGMKFAGKLIKNAGNYKVAKEEFKNAVKPELSEALNYAIPRESRVGEWAQKRFAATSLGDLFETGMERMSQSDDPLKKDLHLALFKRGGGEDQITRSMETVFKGMDKDKADLYTRKNVETLLGTGGTKPANMSPEDYTTALRYLGPLRETLPKVDKEVDIFNKDHFVGKLAADVERLQPTVTMANDEVQQKLFNRLNSVVTTGSTGDINKELYKVITGGVHNNDMVELAKAYYTMPARTIKAVNDAYRTTTLDWFMSMARKDQKLIRVDRPSDMTNFIHVSENPFQGKWKNPVADRIFGERYQGIADMYVDKDLYKTMYEIADSYRYADKLISRYIMRPWKVTRAVASPQPLFRNFFGNFVLNDVMGEHPLSIMNIPFYAKSLKEFNAALKGGKSVANEFIDAVGMNRTTFRGEIDMMKQIAAGEDHNIADAMLEGFYGKRWTPFGGDFNVNLPGAMIKRAENFYGKSELFAKYAKYSWNLTKGMDKDKALIDAVRSTFDYSDVTPFVRYLREGPIPFATFQSKIAKELPNILIEHPIRAAKYVGIPMLMTQLALSQFGMTGKDFSELEANMPDYMRAGNFMLLPWKDDKGRLQLFDMSWWVPGLSTFQFANATEPKQWISNPLWGMARDISANQQGLTNAPIYNDYDTGGVKFGKMLNYIYQNILPIPTWVPPAGLAMPGVDMGDKAIPAASGGVMWKNAIEMLQEKPSAMTPAQVGFTGLGLKVNPVEPVELAATRTKHTERLLRDLDSAMKKEMKNNPNNTDYIQAKYEYLRANLLRQGGK